jgi:hypothetical protein
MPPGSARSGVLPVHSARCLVEHSAGGCGLAQRRQRSAVASHPRKNLSDLSGRVRALLGVESPPDERPPNAHIIGSASSFGQHRGCRRRRSGPGCPAVGSGQPTAWPPVKRSVMTFRTAIISVCHTVCPSTASVITSNIVKNTAQVIVICALPGHRFRFAPTVAVAAILRNLLIVTAEGAPVRMSRFVAVAEPATGAEQEPSLLVAT